jgi:hypothetical protein
MERDSSMAPRVVSPRESPSAFASAWRELADGSAGWPVRLMVSLAVGAFIAGACLILVFMLAAMVPEWNRARGWVGGQGYVTPDETVTAAVLIFGGGAYLAILAWLWTRKDRHKNRSNSIVVASLLTVAITGLATLAGVVAEDNLRGEEELVIGGIVLLAFSVTVLIWLIAVRQFNARRDFRSSEDGLPDVRCPTCGYRMVGLHESRCPECGTLYTLDQLLAKQDFARPVRARDAAFAAGGMKPESAFASAKADPTPASFPVPPAAPSASA